MRIDQLIRKHWDQAYRVALAVTRDPEQAQEAMQDGAASAWRSQGQLRDPGAFAFWFKQIVRRAAFRVSAKAPFWDEVTDNLPDRLDLQDRFAVRDALCQAMGKLSPEHRLVVERVELDGLGCVELAEELGLPPGTVRSRLHYARRQLRLALEEWR